MNSNKYRELVTEAIQNNNLSSNYIKTVGRHLTVFSSLEKKTLYIESKTHRIMEDYSIQEPILWKKNKTGNVLFNNKNGDISFSNANIESNMNHFLFDIPYFLSLHFYKIIKEQNLITFSKDDWLRFFTKRFFKQDLINDSKFNIEMVLDTPLSSEMQDNDEYKSIDKNTIEFFKGETNRAFVGKSSDYTYLYMSFGKRHHLFKII